MKTRRDFVSALGVGGVTAAAQAAGEGKKIRLAVVGGGFGASFHWHEHPNCTVTAVADLYPGRRDALRKAYRCDSVYDSLEEMLKRRSDLDAVAVFTDAPSHTRHAILCMERGLHVVSAVPACHSLEDAGRLLAAKKKTGRRYMMAESSYYRQAAIYARNLYREGGFGEILYTECEYYHDYNFDDRLAKRNSLFYNPDGSNSWRQGMPPMFYPTHAVGFVVGVTRQRIVSVSCLGREERAKAARLKSNPYRNAFFNQFSLMRTDKGHAVRSNECRQMAGAQGERAQWFGEKGALYMALEGVHPDTWSPRYGKAAPAKIPDYWATDLLPPAMRHRSGHGGSAAFISAEFIDALTADREPAIDIYESLAMTVPGLVAHQSAQKNGETLRVPLFDA